MMHCKAYAEGVRTAAATLPMEAAHYFFAVFETRGNCAAQSSHKDLG